MTALTPRITELRKKHKGDRETLNQETMKLYQEAGVNPLMGCLPIVLQMPIFFGLFSVLRYIAEWKHGDPLQYHLTEKVISSAQHAKIFGATIADKVLFTGVPGHDGGIYVPLHAKIVIVIVVLISMTTTYLTVRQSQKRGMMPTGKDSPMGQSQRIMAYVMPLFALTGLYWQFGLVLYWVTTNLWTLGQQYVLLRKYPIGPAVLDTDGKSPTTGTAGRPATAAGLTGRPTKPKPGGTTGTGTPKTGKPASLSKGSGSGSGARSPQARTGKPASSTGNSGNSRNPGNSGKPSASSPSQARKLASSASSSSNGHDPGSNDGGMLGRFVKRRSEPEPEPTPEPEAKIVRQQRTRQSRSKRSGKR